MHLEKNPRKKGKREFLKNVKTVVRAFVSPTKSKQDQTLAGCKIVAGPYAELTELGEQVFKT